jgi:hypothetical protein
MIIVIIAEEKKKEKKHHSPRFASQLEFLPRVHRLQLRGAADDTRAHR